MANDPLAPVIRGEILAITAAAWNEAMGATRDRRQPKRPARPAPPRQDLGTIEASVLNSTGADLREYKPAIVTAAGGYDLADDSPAAHWQRRPLLTLGVPAAVTDYIVVTLEAIPSGSIGRVAVSGVCLCDIDSAAGATYAAPQVGDTAALLGGTTGTVRVLHVPATGGSQRRCAVYLHERPGYGEACGLPLIYRVQIGVSVTTATVSGTEVVTGVTGRFRDVTIGPDGCVSLGVPYCLPADEACAGSESPAVAYWCIAGVCHKVYDGIIPPDGTGPFTTPEECDGECVDAWWCDGGTCVLVAAGDEPPPGATGPHATEAECEAECEPATGGTITCCDPDLTLAATLYLPLSGGNGTLTLVWDGTTYWQTASDVLLPCGETVGVRFNEGCILELRINGGSWVPGTVNLLSLVCSPFSVDVALLIGGGCGTLTGTLSE